MSDRYKGLFVTFEGPHGVGKTSLIKAIVHSLRKLGIEIVLTGEPTNSRLGRFARQAEEKFSGDTLACLYAADRYFHLENEILPALKKGKMIFSDRYVESSLALQRLDGVELDFIWQLNKKIYKPDLSVILTISPTVLKKRFAKRESRSRFEGDKYKKNEVKYYLEAAKFLKKKGFNILLLDSEKNSVKKNAEKVVEKIMKLDKS